MSISGKAIDWHLLKRVFTYIKPFKSIFYLTVSLTVVLAIMAPIRPWLIQVTLDNFIAVGDYAGLLQMTFILIALLVVQSLIQFIYTYRTNWLGQKVINAIRVKLFRHIVDFRLPYFDKTPIGTPVTRVISDLETVGSIFSNGIITIISDILQMAGVLIVMFYIDWQLALMVLLPIPVLIVATNIFKNKIRKVFTDVRNRVAELNVFVQEHLTGMRIVQIFNREREEMKKFQQINEKHRDAHIRSVWYYSIFFPVVEILSATSIALLIWWGARGVIEDRLTVGILVQFLLFLYMLFRPIRELADKFNTLQMGMVGSERVFDVLDQSTGFKNEGKKQPNEIKGEIEFRNVWFAYLDEEWVLKNVSFKVEPGKMLALVGATGSGKTTIINLLSRFYDIQKGQILVDGVDITEYDVAYLRSKIALVLQDVFLFSDSIMNNITLKNSDILPQDVRAISERIGANRFVEKLPGKYEFNVQERGQMLSQGQRQLISFIRAYVYKPSIMILDEATSSIDAESEEMISKATRELTSERTSIVIAHRLSTIQKADEILVLDHGEIKERGNHQNLLKKGGLYKNLFEIQFQSLVKV